MKTPAAVLVDALATCDHYYARYEYTCNECLEKVIIADRDDVLNEAMALVRAIEPGELDPGCVYGDAYAQEHGLILAFEAIESLKVKSRRSVA